MAKSPSRAARYQKLLREAARDLGVNLKDDRVSQVATLRLMREAVVAKLLNGGEVDPGVVLQIDTALKALLPFAGATRGIEVTYTSYEEGICPQCGFVSRHEGETSKWPAAETPTSDDGKPAAEASTETPAPAPAPAPANVVDLRQRALSQAPLKRLQEPEPWRDYTAGSPAGPTPAFPILPSLTGPRR